MKPLPSSRITLDAVSYLTVESPISTSFSFLWLASEILFSIALYSFFRSFCWHLFQPRLYLEILNQATTTEMEILRVAFLKGQKGVSELRKLKQKEDDY